jgi:hypothetical protein
MTFLLVAVPVSLYVLLLFSPAHWRFLSPSRRRAVRAALLRFKASPEQSKNPLERPGAVILLEDESKAIVQLRFMLFGERPGRRRWFLVTQDNQVTPLTASECEQYGIEIPIWL